MTETGYTRSRRPSVDIRTLSPALVSIARRLQAEGYTVLKRGWPTFLAYNPTENRLRFIRVVSHRSRPRQPGRYRYDRLVDDWLRGVLGIEVERVEG